MEHTITKNRLRLIVAAFAIALMVGGGFADDASAMPSYCGSWSHNWECYFGKG
jgi:hypothetical protein